MPIVMFLTTSDLMRPDQNSCFSWARGAERPTMDSTIRCPIRRLCCLPSLQEPPRWSTGPQTEVNMNTHAQAEVRRNRLKNNTTRLSPAPDQALRDCWLKRRLAVYDCVGLVKAFFTALGRKKCVEKRRCGKAGVKGAFFAFISTLDTGLPTSTIGLG